MKVSIKISDTSDLYSNNFDLYNIVIGKSCYLSLYSHEGYPFLSSYGIKTEIKHYRSVRLCSKVQKLNLEILRINK